MSGQVIAARVTPIPWRKLLTVLIWLAVLLAFTNFAWTVVVPGETWLTHGFAAYYTASRLLLTGQFDARVYDNDWFGQQVAIMMNGEAGDIYNVNPPTTAWMMLGLAHASPHAARLAWTLGNLALLVAAIALLAWELGLSWSALGVLALIAMGFAPLAENFRLGQAYVLMLFLYALAFHGFLRGKDWLLGLSLALMLVFKTAGWPLLLLLLLHRRWRALAFAFGGVDLVLFGSLPWIGVDVWQTYLAALPGVGREPWASSVLYQTTNSLWQHLLRPDPQFNPGPVADLPWLAAVLIVLSSLTALGITVWAARRNKPRDLSFAAFVALVLLLTPVGEQHHHTVMLLPVAVALARLLRPAANGSRLSQGYLFAVSVALLALSFDLRSADTTGWGALTSYPRVYGAWLLWGLLIIQLVRAEPEATRQPTRLALTREAWLLLGLFVAALALRLAYVVVYRFDGLYGQDAFEYFRYGRTLWETGGRVPLTGPVYWPLGYPYLIMSGFLLTGVRPLGGQLVSLLTAAAAAPLAALLARDLLLRAGVERTRVVRIALVAGILVAACGQLVQSSIVVMADAAGLFWVLLSAWALVRAEGTRRPAWLLLAACALAAAVMTRWANGLLALPWAAYWVYERRRTTDDGRRSIVYGPSSAVSYALPIGVLIAAALVLTPQVVQSASDESAPIGPRWLQQWNPANALQSDFVTDEGFIDYRLPVGVFYLQPAFHPFFLFPLLTPALLIGLWRLWQEVREGRQWIGLSILLVGWPLVQYVFLSGIPNENMRYGLVYFPPLAILTGLGADALWTRLRSRRARTLLLGAGALGVADAVLGLAHDLGLSHSGQTRRPGDREMGPEPGAGECPGAGLRYHGDAPVLHAARSPRVLL
jgi:4-amino-4-deoxy-L-arabinose transferase-like glycosyltransferase